MSHLFLFAGLPGTGKTTLSQRLARHIDAVYLRIDTIEQALKELYGLQAEGDGYRLAYRIAADNLGLGLDVVADSCNPIQLTRREWEHVAIANEAGCTNIELVCSDADEYRHRIEKRSPDIPGLKQPSWRDVENREYHRWINERIVIDTAGRSKKECFEVLLLALGIPMTNQ